MSEKETYLQHQNQILNAIRSVNQLMIRERDPVRLLDGVCRILVESREYHNAWLILTRNGHPIEPFFHTGFGSSFKPMATMLQAGEIPSCAASTLSTGELIIITEPKTDCGNCPLLSSCPGSAGLSKRIEHDGRIFGWLTLSSPADYVSNTSEHDLIRELTADIAYALAAIENQNDLNQSRKMFRDVLDTIPDMIWLKDAGGKYLFCNEALARLVESSREKIIGGTDYDIFPKEKADFYKEHDQAALENARTTINEETADYINEGYSIWLETSKTPIYDNNHHVIGILGIGRDISRANLALKESEANQALLNMILEKSPFPMWLASPDGTTLRANQAHLTAINLKAEEFVGKYNILQDTDFTAAEASEKLKEIFEEKRPVRFDTVWKPVVSDSREIYLDIALFPILNQDSEIGHVIIQWVDITARKKSEEKLRISEEILRESQQNAGIAHWSFDPVSGMPWWSEELYQIYGRDPAKGPLPYEDHPQLVHQNDWEWFDATVRNTAETGEPFDIVLRILRPDGSIRFINSICKPQIDERGNLIEMRGTIQDVTKIKLAEEALETSEEKARLMSDLVIASNQPVAVGYADGRLVICNPAFCSLTGYSEEELQSMNWSTELTPAEWLPVESAYLEEMEKTGQPARYEKEYIRKDGTRVPVELLTHRALTPEGSTDYFYAFITDITERKRVEWILEDNERRYRTLLENLPGMAYRVRNSREWPMEFVSAGSQLLTGYSSGELTGPDGINYIELIHPEDRDTVWELIQRSIENNTGFDIEYRVVDRKGQTRWVSERGQAVGTDENGAVTLEGLITDITNFKKTKDELTQSRTQLEELSHHLHNSREELSAYIAREIHDDLGQSIGGLKMMFDVMYQQLRIAESEDAEFKQLAGSIRGAIDASINKIRELSRNLKPGILEMDGLVEAIKALVEQNRHSGIEFETSYTLGTKTLSAEKELAVYRIVQEAFMNILRHSRATKVTISISTDGDSLLMNLTDNGIGFDRYSPSVKSGFGLMSMKERARYCGGTLEISGDKNSGTGITVSIPLQEA